MPMPNGVRVESLPEQNATLPLHCSRGIADSPRAFHTLPTTGKTRAKESLPSVNLLLVRPRRNLEGRAKRDRRSDGGEKRKGGG